MKSITQGRLLGGSNNVRVPGLLSMSLHGYGAGAARLNGVLCMQVCHGIAQRHGCCTISGVEAACARREPDHGQRGRTRGASAGAAVGLDVWLGGLAGRRSPDHWVGRVLGLGCADVG